MGISKATVKAMGAFVVTGYTAKIINAYISEHYPRNKKALALTTELFDKCKEVRNDWMKLSESELKEFEGKVQLFLNNKAVKDVPGHTLFLLAHKMLVELQSELWDAGSRKGGAVDELVRRVEDLHEMFKDEDPIAHRQEAGVLYRNWIDSLSVKIQKKRKLRYA